MRGGSSWMLSSSSSLNILSSSSGSSRPSAPASPSAWADAKLYNKFFQKLEDQMNGTGESEREENADGEEQEDERIFKDELDESLQEEPPRIG